MIIGSTKMKLVTSDLGHMLNVSLFIGASAAATKLIELLSNYNFGDYQVVAMGVINLVGVVVVQFFKDTRTEIVEEPTV